VAEGSSESPREADMPQYLFQVAYTSGSWAKQVRDQGNVLERISPLLKACNGRVDSCFYAFGDYDLVLIADFPNAEEAAAFSLAATAGGSLKAIKTTPLLTVDQGISAMHRAAEAGKNYVPPVDTPANR
jgi:uncharacterized protein with GYD domain